jgi:hypothetical protein
MGSQDSLPKMEIKVIGLCPAAMASVGATSAFSTAPVSDAMHECVDCHASHTPGIVGNQRNGRHSQIAPADGLIKPPRNGKCPASQYPLLNGSSAVANASGSIRPRILTTSKWESRCLHGVPSAS